MTKVSELVDGVLQANIGILIDDESKALLAYLKGFETRCRRTADGSDDSRTEGWVYRSLRTNTTLIRRRIKSPKLKLESFTIGELSKTDVAVAYIEGVASESLLKEVRAKLS